MDQELTTQPVSDALPHTISLTQLTGVMLKVGGTGFGMGMIGVLQQEVVNRRAWLSQEDFASGIALANLLPGPVAVDVAVYVGYKMRGWLGATISLLSLLTPAFFLMLGLTIAYLKYGQTPKMQGVFAGLNAAIVALVLSVAWRIGKNNIKTALQAILVVLVIIALFLAHANYLILFMLACGVIGMFLFRPEKKS